MDHLQKQEIGADWGLPDEGLQENTSSVKTFGLPSSMRTMSLLQTADHPSFNRVTGILEAANGDLWVRGVDDAWRVPAAELTKVLLDRSSAVKADHFDALDGLDSMGLQPKVTVVEADDGMIWFGTNKGLAWFDPSRSKPPTPAPLQLVTSINMDGELHDATGVITLPPLTHRVEIAYTAIELGYPERIQFRYKLDGVNRVWQSAGSRRVAYYIDLAPGDYSFRFISTDRDGHWRNASETSMVIKVLPAWFQTGLFKAGAVLLAGLRFHYLDGTAGARFV